MRRNNASQSENHELSFWQSYSDMMAAMLLVFVLVLSGTLLQTQKVFEEKQKELNAQEELIEQQQDKLNKINSQSQEAKKLISELKKYGAKVSYIQYDGRYIETDFTWKSKFYELYINVRPSSGEKKLQVYMNSTSYMPSVTNVADIDAILKDVQNMKKIVELLEETNLYKILYRM